ncbi:innate immunity activator protein isoform X2 [Microcaecilia unicolor]|uniref:Innate immunity activator protein isoform X2 n=1 Tax=Microcaecilia unicolor TaxID=1415580 RepID=A0A6P7ZUP7_9AMPH|nr:innate immunity activator protein isoform X2 [Microcaecilia unicolor]
MKDLNRSSSSLLVSQGSLCALSSPMESGSATSQPLPMEGKDETSDTDSGIILQSGPDSPLSPMKDLTYAMRKQQQALEEKLEACLLELKKLCLREAELTGKLPKEFPLKPGEKTPKIRRRIGTTFKLDEKIITSRAEVDPLGSLERDLALQLQIVEAAHRLYREENLTKQIRKHRKTALIKEEKKLKELENSVNEHRKMVGQRPLHSTGTPIIEELNTSDDSSLSDSAILDEEETQTHLPTEPSGTAQSHEFPICLTQSNASQNLEGRQLIGHGASDTEPSPIQNSPWRESSLDQPYERPKKLLSNSQTSSPLATPRTTPLSSPTDPRAGESPLYSNIPVVKITLKNSTSAPSTPEMPGRRTQCQSFRVQSPQDPLDTRGRSAVPRRRVTYYTVTVPDYCFPQRILSQQLSNPTYHSSSEDSNSDTSSISQTTSGGNTSPDMTPPRPVRHLPTRSASPVFINQNFEEFESSTFHRSPQALLPPGYYAHVEPLPRSHSRPPLKGTRPAPAIYEETIHVRTQQLLCPQGRVGRVPSLKENTSKGLSKAIVCEELQSWHQRTRLRNASRPRSLDRQGAIRIRNTATREAHLARSMTQRIQVPQRHVLKRTPEGAPAQWYDVQDAEIVSQV